MFKPVIGVAFAKPDYVAALEKAGAEVRELIPSTAPLPESLEGLDGLLLTGGPDVRPSLYGATVQHPTVTIDDERDGYELPLVRAALERDLPLLAICRGVQVLNVAAGGTLIQDLPSERPGLAHTVEGPKTAIGHDISVAAGSRLAGIFTSRLDAAHRLGVNSRHHQAIDAVAPGFIVSATAGDGTIEAIESLSQAFCLGVQWHPENFWRTGEAASLFEGFVQAAIRARTRLSPAR
jgi:putative glutamine amidotransferase